MCIIECDKDTQPVLVKAWQIKDGLQGFLKKGWMQEQFDIIVCENFTLRNSVTFPDLSPVYIIGALEALAVQDIIYQRPAEKPVCPDNILKVMNFYQVSMPHANDAIRHAVIYLRKQRHIPTIKLGWPNKEE